jgi:hypothetical protein
MAINFDLSDLKAFRAVAELSSLRKAAEAIHISQPAFSRRIESSKTCSACACSSARRAASA